MTPSPAQMPARKTTTGRERRPRVNRNLLAAAVAKELDVSQTQGVAAVTAVMNAITDALVDGSDVQVPGVGTWSPVDRAGRTGRNPATGEPVTVPASRSVKFRPGTALRARLNPDR
ncbi:HU family DNA-binding protein [Streptomyces sp. WMMC897]|uniref:HU family DNA-binding protein n=1 Tax=Streptomyces sp. WMMC897 TaxID=3014782 RepID=UPI0022B73021|nr:HU family DNA-binding protein [Streptomyces sp. WMMC897]MCZ7414286.1 HU family DNA-binding protein [Streptomyces sp. WMMC897]